MKRVLAHAAVAAFGCVAFIAVGCSAAAPSTSTPNVGGNGDVPRGQTDWPQGNPDPVPPHRAYPLVLAHGFSGFQNIGPLNYFYGVADALSKDGHQVFTTIVDPYNSSEVRGAELLTQVEDILAKTGAPKVNLICHSQGALDCRYVAHELGAAKIGAVVMVAGVNHGDYVADVASGLVQGVTADAVNAIMTILGAVLDPNGNPSTDAKAAIAQLTTPGVEAFNQKYPDAPGVAYYSIAGRSDNDGGDVECSTPTETPFVEKWDLVKGPVNPLLYATAKILDGDKTADAPLAPTNDGMVTVASAKWGTFLGCVPADHFSEVCQIGGQSSGSSYNCVTMYRDIADWLVARGF